MGPSEDLEDLEVSLCTFHLLLQLLHLDQPSILVWRNIIGSVKDPKLMETNINRWRRTSRFTSELQLQLLGFCLLLLQVLQLLCLD